MVGYVGINIFLIFLLTYLLHIYFFNTNKLLSIFKNKKNKILNGVKKIWPKICCLKVTIFLDTWTILVKTMVKETLTKMDMSKMKFWSNWTRKQKGSICQNFRIKKTMISSNVNAKW